MTELSAASRAHLVAAADGERRRIERALHDGVQQDLIAVSVRLQLARRLARTDLTAAVAVLDEVSRDVQDALDRVRALADEIYPSLLEGRGLVDALRGAASAGGVLVRVEAAELGRYPDEAEAAVYFCCRAVLDAVAANGADAGVTVRIRTDERALLLAVESDLPGFDDMADRLALACERIEVLGGLVTLERAGSVVRLTATVPIA